jgi:hypothetical protein
MRSMMRTVGPALVALVLLAGCGSEVEGGDAGGGGGADGGSPAPTVVVSDEERDDVDCTPEGLGADEATEFTSVHQVVDGELGAVCLGEEDPSLLAAWDDLAAITPPGQLTDLALFAGFVHPDADEQGDGAETTLAFVNAVDDEGTAFQMSIDLDQLDTDRDQALLTLAHEFSHVFSTASTQMDRSPEAIDACDTYLTRDGCFLPDSLMAEWVATFWADGQLDGIDPEVDPSLEAGAELCSTDPSFLGEYAASDPEEDFAETFSAFVFDVEVDAPELQDKLDWMGEQPGLVEFRDRADAAGLAPLPNAFDGCG